MEFTLNINMDNAAFEAMPERELAAILENVAQYVLDGNVLGNNFDANGNIVGTWEIIED